ncbi:MAG: glycosyltransferase family 2 protein [Candidatus Hydrogenedentota bacterium]|nr:MAG: glycosyltransferase family 2 protein [Candidatus Hydrogenedentota bacterium]
MEKEETIRRKAKLSLVIPVYNEEETVETLLERLLFLAEEFTSVQLVIVDDGSSDETRDRIRRFLERPKPQNLETTFAAQERNQGKGAALRKGIELCTGEIIVIQDADLEYDPRDIPRLVQPILDGVADVVYGSRFLGGPHRVLYFWHYVGNTFLTLLSNMFSNINLTDMETCYKAFRAEVLKGLRLREDRFGIEVEMTAKVAKARARIYEIPISYYGRTYEEGKKITWKDGLAAFYHILRYNLFS